MIFEQKDLHKISVLGDKKYTQAPELEVGKIYNVFDDGKISYSRLIQWEILEAIDLDNENTLPDEILSQLGEEIKSCYWLYSPEQTIIYRAKMIDSTQDYYCYFLRTKQGGWFGALSWFDGEVDYDNKLSKMLEGE